MKLKNCPACKKEQTTKTAHLKGRNEIGLWFDCANPECKSTYILRVNNHRHVFKKSVSEIVMSHSAKNTADNTPE